MNIKGTGKCSGCIQRELLWKLSCRILFTLSRKQRRKKTFSTNLLSKWFSLMTLIWQNQNFSGNWIHSNKWGAWNDYRPLSTFLPSLSFAKPIQNRYFSAVIMCLLLRLPWTSFPLDCVWFGLFLVSLLFCSLLFCLIFATLLHFLFLLFLYFYKKNYFAKYKCIILKIKYGIT